jgi:hypothetical protein
VTQSDILSTAMRVVCFDPFSNTLNSEDRDRARPELVDECERCHVYNLHGVEGTGKLHGFTITGHFAGILYPTIGIQ